MGFTDRIMAFLWSITSSDKEKTKIPSHDPEESTSEKESDVKKDGDDFDKKSDVKKSVKRPLTTSDSEDNDDPGSETEAPKCSKKSKTTNSSSRNEIASSLSSSIIVNPSKKRSANDDIAPESKEKRTKPDLEEDEDEGNDSEVQTQNVESKVSPRTKRKRAQEDLVFSDDLSPKKIFKDLIDKKRRESVECNEKDEKGDADENPVKEISDINDLKEDQARAKARADHLLEAFDD